MFVISQGSYDLQNLSIFVWNILKGYQISILGETALQQYN